MHARMVTKAARVKPAVASERGWKGERKGGRFIGSPHTGDGGTPQLGKTAVAFSCMLISGPSPTGLSGCPP